LPNLRSLSQLRVLLPYAAKLLPVLTGIAIAEPSRQSADLSSLDRRFGEIQTESRGLRSQVANQGEEIERVLKTHQEGLERVASGIEGLRREQQDLAKESQALARWLKGLSFAILLLLIAVTVMSALIFFRMSHV
jgi:septal ring factor EnvC (AmiA/AmiB activator)